MYCVLILPLHLHSCHLRPKQDNVRPRLMTSDVSEKSIWDLSAGERTQRLKKVCEIRASSNELQMGALRLQETLHFVAVTLKPRYRLFSFNHRPQIMLELILYASKRRSILVLLHLQTGTSVQATVDAGGRHVRETFMREQL